jgi:hypothetical protein
MALGIVVADYIVFWDATFVLGGGGNRTSSPLRRHHYRDRDGDHLPNPAEFAMAAEQAASARAASIVSAHTASQIVSIVTILAADQPAAVAVALAVVSDALRRPVVAPTR